MAATEQKAIDTLFLEERRYPPAEDFSALGKVVRLRAGLAGGMGRLADQAPFLQVAKMVLGDPWIQAADVARTVELAPERVMVCH